MQCYPRKLYITGLPVIYSFYNGEYVFNLDSSNPKWYSPNYYLGVGINNVYIKKIINPIYNWVLCDKNTNEILVKFKLVNGEYYGSDILPIGKCIYTNTVFSIDPNSYTSCFYSISKMYNNMYNKTYNYISSIFYNGEKDKQD